PKPPCAPGSLRVRSPAPAAPRSRAAVRTRGPLQLSWLPPSLEGGSGEAWTPPCSSFRSAGPCHTGRTARRVRDRRPLRSPSGRAHWRDSLLGPGRLPVVNRGASEMTTVKIDDESTEAGG